MKCPYCEKEITVILNKKKGRPSERFIPPSAEEVKAYADAIGFPIDAGSFIDYYLMKDWKVGKDKMKDWKAAVRNWFRNFKTRNPDFVAPVETSESDADDLLGDLYER